MAIKPLTARSNTTADPNLLIVKENHGVKTLTLNRPSKLNALSIELIEVLSIELLKTEQDTKTQVLILRGNGKAFCAGGDVSALAIKAKSASPELINEGNTFMQRQYQLNHIAASFRKPAIAVWHKIAMGGGIGISIPLDFRIATESTMIAMPECGIAFFPDVGASYFLNQLKPGVGLYLGLTGTRVLGYEAVVFGLATHFIHSSQVEQALNDLEAVSSATTDLSLSQIDTILGSHDHKVKGSSQSLLDDIESVFTLDSVEKILAKLQSMDTDWSRTCIKSIRAGSPTALKVTFSLLNRTKTLSASECRAIEYIVHTNFMHLPDFVEGVHKKLIERPPSVPVWKPGRIDDCSDEYIESFFQARETPLQLRTEPAFPGRQNRFVRI